MSFSAKWLELRRDADTRARSAEITARLADYVATLDTDTLQILDLGSGTGANLAYLAPKLQVRQFWVLTDNDASLLSRVDVPRATDVDRTTIDLANGIEHLFGRRPDVVTSSAFFDLAGSVWIDDLVAHVADAGAAFHTVLTYDGTERWSPTLDDDHAVLEAFVADQRTEKGLGTALGPAATDYLSRALEQHGYAVHRAPSPWDLKAENDASLIEALADGVLSAIGADLGDIATRWHRSRRRASAVHVGHEDLIALPPTRAR
ncbi:MAG: class I SAM-dependent methyltransferase [Pseudomonadota bacterium]